MLFSKPLLLSLLVPSSFLLSFSCCWWYHINPVTAVTVVTAKIVDTTVSCLCVLILSIAQSNQVLRRFRSKWMWLYWRLCVSLAEFLFLFFPSSFLWCLVAFERCRTIVRWFGGCAFCVQAEKGTVFKGWELKDSFRMWWTHWNEEFTVFSFSFLQAISFWPLWWQRKVFGVVALLMSSRLDPIHFISCCCSTKHLLPDELVWLVKNKNSRDVICIQEH